MSHERCPPRLTGSERRHQDRTRGLVSRVCGTLTALSLAVGSTVAAQDAPDVRPAILSVDTTRAPDVQTVPRQAGTASARPQGKTSRKWEIEGHIGGSFFSNPTSGAAQLPPAGASYQVAPLFPLPPEFPGAREWPSSRVVSSWYFGDGSVLFNDARPILSRSVPITPLDPALTRAGDERDGGLLFGFRVARALNDRLSAEFSFDASLARVRMGDDARAAIETTSTSFEQAFDGLSWIGFAGVDSNVTIHREGGGQLNATGALTVNLLTGHRWTPYATIGGGVASSVGDMPRATLVGKYQVLDIFEETGTILVDDTDTVNVRYEMNPAGILLLGGGFKFDLSPRAGIRGDVRFGIASNRGRVVIDTEASHAGVSYFSLALIGSNSTAVFSSPGNARQPSLSGPTLSGFETFTGTRYQVDTAITVGYFTRF